MNYKPKNILVTGAAGFIGSNYVRMMLSRYDGSVANLLNGYNISKISYL
jgi:nucleoside-diphosphate-sugar epimerase